MDENRATKAAAWMDTQLTAWRCRSRLALGMANSSSLASVDALAQTKRGRYTTAGIKPGPLQVNGADA
jgi:hypothetical protein